MYQSAVVESGQPEHGDERIVDRPHFFWRQQVDSVAQSLRVDGTDLLDEHARGLAGTSISGRNDAGRALRDVGATMTIDRGRSSSACNGDCFRHDPRMTIRDTARNPKLDDRQGRV